MSTLSQHDRIRLVKLLRLLGSDHAGERDAAGLAAHRMLKQLNLTWEEALAPPPLERQLPVPVPASETWRSICTRLMRNVHWLTPWERRFVAGLPHFPYLSGKQRHCLNEIAGRVLGVQA